MAQFPDFFRRNSLSNRSSGRTDNPFRELSRLQSQIDRMFDDFLAPDGTHGSDSGNQIMTSPAWNPSCEIEERDGRYVLSFDLPGVKQEDIKIEAKDGYLSVSGERKMEHEEKDKSRIRTERFYGNFYRSFALPTGLKPEQIEADFKDGILQIAVPKIETARSHQIKIGKAKSAA